MSWTNYHSHSQFCDGQGTLESYVKQAIKAKMPMYGFSGHSPVTFHSVWNMTPADLPVYLSETKRLKEIYRQSIKLFTGLEIDFIPGISTVSHFKTGLDYTIGGVHYLKQLPNGKHWEVDKSADYFAQGLNEIFGGNIQQLVRYYYQQVREMLATDPPDVLAHLDLVAKFNKGNRFFDENADWYRNEIVKTVEMLAQTDCIVEINTRSAFKGLRDDFHPSLWILRHCRNMNVPVTISADAHSPKEIDSLLGHAAQYAQAAGYGQIFVFDETGWHPVSFSEEGILL